MRRRPKVHEESAAIILSKYFSSDATFIMESGYGSPDIKIGNLEWELKSPEGASHYSDTKQYAEGWSSINKYRHRPAESQNTS